MPQAAFFFSAAAFQIPGRFKIIALYILTHQQSDAVPRADHFTDQIRVFAIS
jgi:hypothetical protein